MQPNSGERRFSFCLVWSVANLSQRSGWSKQARPNPIGGLLKCNVAIRTLIASYREFADSREALVTETVIFHIY